MRQRPFCIHSCWGHLLVPHRHFSNYFGPCAVIATLGPPCRDTVALTELLKAGCTAVRVDLTWGPIEYHVQSLKNLAAACKATGKLCAVIVDTVGRELLIRRPITLDAQARAERRTCLLSPLGKGHVAWHWHLQKPSYCYMLLCAQSLLVSCTSQTCRTTAVQSDFIPKEVRKGAMHTV